MRRPRQPRDEGASSVEFALVASFLLLPLLFGIIQYGFYFFQATAAEHVAQEGARLAAVGIDDCETWKQQVRQRATGVAMTELTLGAPRTPGEESTVPQQPEKRGDEFEVVVTWIPAIDLPFVPGIPESMDETAISRVERVGDVKAAC